MPTRVYILDSGSLQITEAQMLWNRGSPKRLRVPCYSVLIDHASGLYLFDTGFDLAAVQRNLPSTRPRQSPNQSLVQQLRLLDISPDDIGHVINSHYHFDHCGGNARFGSATFVCHEREYAAALHPHEFEKSSYMNSTFLELLDRTRLTTVSGDVVLSDGIWLIETTGHTAGHYSLMVELAGRRPMLFTADAAWTEQNLTLDCIPSFHFDPLAATRSIARLRKLAAEYDAELFFPHDPVAFEQYHKAPMFYT
ncbi:N-acyl homoserine lactonase family protein [Kribbella sp. NPDC004536]|uniref:N-acyl homoserine lactonase family protein n=1 Tax=Kribbella sp. NPDC004536 TaxID=3364106 RepID=UPI0036905418